MVIHNFHRLRPRRPAKTYPPLIIDADAVLPLAPAAQRLQPVSRRNREVRKTRDRMQLQQLSTGRALDVWREPPGTLRTENLLRFLVGKTHNHSGP